MGPLLGARRAHAGWLRDKRSELVENFYGLLYEARTDLNEREVTAKFGSGRAPEPTDPVALSTRLGDAAARAKLYTSEELGRAMPELAVGYLECATLLDIGTTQDWGKRLREWTDDAESVQALIRQELGVR